MSYIYVRKGLLIKIIKLGEDPKDFVNNVVKDALKLSEYKKD